MDGKRSDDIEMKRGGSPSQKEPFLGPRSSSRGGPSPVAQITNNPALSILAYCLSSISMTVVNKYCVSGRFWNMNFFLLGVQVSLGWGVMELCLLTG